MRDLSKRYMGCCLLKPELLGKFPIDPEFLHVEVQELYKIVYKLYLQNELTIQRVCIEATSNKICSLLDVDDIQSFGYVVTPNDMKVLVEKIKYKYTCNKAKIWAADLQLSIEKDQFKPEEAMSQFMEISKKSTDAPFDTLRSLSVDWLGKIIDGVDHVSKITLNSYLDDRWYLTNGGVHIIAGRPAMGKTYLAIWIAVQALLNNHSVLFFSLEMIKAQILHRFYSTLSSANEPIAETVNKFYQLPLYLNDDPTLTIERAAVIASLAKSVHNVGLIIFDYVQLIKTAEKFHSREQQIAHISATLKLIAMSCKCPVIALAQLNRQSESRADNVPLLSDLRESGALEQDADSVMLMLRPEYYLIQKQQVVPEEEKNKVILTLAKQRHYKQSNTICKWYRETNKWEFFNRRAENDTKTNIEGHLSGGMVNI